MPNVECRPPRRAATIAHPGDRALTRFANRQPPTANRRPPNAFTFVEVLFAIIILGIGMIMIAGILPVAIKQNSDTRDELTGKAVAEAGYAYVRTAIQQDQNAFIPTNAFDIFDPTGTKVDTVGRVVPLSYDFVANNDPLTYIAGLQASRISSSDPRFQWLAFYRRDQDARVISVVVLAMRLHNTDPVDRYSVTTGRATLDKEIWNQGNGPFVVQCTIQDGGELEPDRLVFSNYGGKSFDTQVAAPGAFVIVNSAAVAGSDAQAPSRNNGRVFRLAARRDDLDPSGRTYDLDPGYDLPALSTGPDLAFGTADDVADASMATTPVTAWMVGRGRTNPAADANDMNSFGGLPQDVLVLKADIPLQ